MELYDYILPSLTVLVPLLYIIGLCLKSSRLPDHFIPLLLGAAGIVLALVWLFSIDLPSSGTEAVKLILTGIAQGTLCAAVSVYSHNIYKQLKEGNSDDPADDKD